jgi:5-methyltetrahydrofolate--homocysteine methyltransferase
VTAAKTEKEDRSGWPVGDRLKQRIIDGEHDGIESDLDIAMAEGNTAIDIINTFLLDGMKVVGELFGAGEMQLPFVLRSAETMKRSVAYLEPYMEKLEGKVVLATVKGDVHDIGKNLVDIILTNNGYDVHNLGIKIAINEMIEKAIEIDADLIGMSGLLVKSTLIMRENLEELNARGLERIPVILGGAALNRTFVERDLREVYNGRVFYGKDAFEGLDTFDKLMTMKRSGEDDPDWGRKLGGRNIPRREPKPVVDPSTLPSVSPEVSHDNEVYKPPFIGSRVERGISLDEIAAYINETALFRNQWQFRPEKGEADTDFKDRIRPNLRAALADAKRTGVLVPQVVYGYWPANKDGNDLVVWSDESRSTELTRFNFPRQTHEPYLCIADFFRPLESGDVDYAAFHIVTMGNAVSEETARLFKADKYQDYLTLHGLGVEMAEALAEYWHHRIRTEWGFVDQDGPSLAGLFRQQYRGGRYSWGYPACPDLEDNAKVGELLESARIGVEVSEETSFQYHPEQTTSALICHHPKAKYFVAN